MDEATRHLLHLGRELKGISCAERALDRLLDLKVPESFRELTYFRTIDPALDFFIPFPARSRAQVESGPASWPGEVFPCGSSDHRLERAHLYFHVPFCRHICKYCIFFERQGGNANYKDRATHYLDAMRKEWERIVSIPALERMAARSIYVGGGTPTSLDLAHLERLTGIISEGVTIEPGAEFCFEAHPATLDREKLDVLAARGVNRLSMGVESLDNEVLELVGRVGYHKEEVPIVLQMIQDAGIKNVNIDMIYGLPGETHSKFAGTLTYLTELIDSDLLTSVSWYPYTPPESVPSWPRGHFVANSMDMFLMSAMIRSTFMEELQSTEMPARFFRPQRYSDGRPKEASVDWSRVIRDRLLPAEDTSIGCGNYAYTHVDHTGYSTVNERNVKRYMERIQAGDSPVASALLMTDELRMERSILRGCQVGAIHPAVLEEAFGYDLLTQKSSTLDEMHSHGLLEFRDDQVVLAEKAKLNLEGVARELAFMPGRYESLI